MMHFGFKDISFTISALVYMFCLIPALNKKLNSADDPCLQFYYRLCDLERVLTQVTSH